MTHASVFSGIGGPEVAAAMLGWENLFHCEINPFGRAVLDYWFPNSRSYEDITTTDFSEWGGKVNVLTGGFPCQPFSCAGRRRGEKDDRYLWPFMHRCINQVRPDWVVCENVAGIASMVEQGRTVEVETEKKLFDEADPFHRYRLEETFTLERICEDLESDGYSVQAFIIPACAVGAPHRRDRVFIIGNRNDAQNTMRCGQLHGQYEVSGRERDFGDIGSGGSERICRETQGVDSSNADSIGQSTHGRHCGREREKMDKRSGDKSFDGTERLGASQTIANTKSDSWGNVGTQCGGVRQQVFGDERRAEVHDGFSGLGGERFVADSIDGGVQRRCNNGEQCDERVTGQFKSGGESNCPRYKQGRHTNGRRRADYQVGERWANFPTVSPIHRGNDGLPFSLDDLTISASKWRTESLKAYGNAIVPQVMYEIFKAIEQTYL